MKIGFIGLGVMGRPMAKNLIRAGHELTVADHHPEHIAELVELGAKPAACGKEAAEGAEVVITMLPNSPQVEAAVCDEDGILAGSHPGQILIDMSSIAPLASHSLAERCRQAGVTMLDAPVSGGEPKAIDGTLSIMAGGDAETFEEVKSLLLEMGSSAVHCGPCGAGNTVKLANQIIVAVNIAAVAEAFTLAVRTEVKPEVLFEAIRGGLAGSTVMEAKAPMMIAGHRQPGFRIDLHIKDLNNALETGHAAGAPLPLTAQVMEMLELLSNQGFGAEDHSALTRYYELLSGVALHS